MFGAPIPAQAGVPVSLEATRNTQIVHLPRWNVEWYDGAIMMARTQVTLGSELRRRARQRASDLGVSLAEYFRRLVARDLTRPEVAAEVDCVFDLGDSGGSDIASDKDEMIGQAFRSSRRRSFRKTGR